jgi:hypothetical protein
VKEVASATAVQFDDEADTLPVPRVDRVGGTVDGN